MRACENARYRLSVDSLRYAMRRSGYMKDGKVRCAALAADAGISQNTMRGFIRCPPENPTVSMVAQLADVLDCSIEDLLEERDRARPI